MIYACTAVPLLVLCFFPGDKPDGFGRNAPVYHVYPSSRATSEERAKCSKGLGIQGSLRDAGNVKSRARRKAKRETPVTHA